MENQPPQLDMNTTVVSLTERHLQEWFQLLGYMQGVHSAEDQVVVCQNQITQLQQDLYQLRSL